MPSESLKKEINGFWSKTTNLKLNNDSTDVQSESYDFSEHQIGEDWDIAIERTDEEMENGDWEPQMNFRYHLPRFSDRSISNEEIKKALEHVAITVVQDLKSDEHYLALTGGGMDMSWDIVKGYTKLGFVPPAQFCRDLPSFAGDRLTKDNKEAILACRKSLALQMMWNVRGMEKLDRLSSEMRANSKR